MVSSFIVEDGSGLVDANAFCDVSFVTNYLANYGAVGWTGTSNDDREEAIRQMTRWLTISKEWNGFRRNQLQALSHPRLGLYDHEGYPVSHTIVHVNIKQATAYGAWRILRGDWNVFADEEGFSNETSKTIKIGPITISSSSAAGGVNSNEEVLPVVQNLIRQFLKPSNPEFLERG